MCSFDICSEYDVFIKMINHDSYDLFFLTKDIVLHPQFPAIYSNSSNSQTPIILYEYSFFLHYLIYRKQNKRGKVNSKQSSFSNDSSSISLNTLPTTPLYILNNISISGEIFYPFTLIDVCTIILQFVFLPAYLQYHMDITELQEKCSSSSSSSLYIVQYIQNKLNQYINNQNAFIQDDYSSSLPIIAIPSYDQSSNNYSCPFVYLDVNSNQSKNTTIPSTSSFTEMGVSSSLFETPSYDYSMPFFQTGGCVYLHLFNI